MQSPTHARTARQTGFFPFTRIAIALLAIVALASVCSAQSVAPNTHRPSLPIAPVQQGDPGVDQAPPPGPSSWLSVLRTGVALAGVLALIFGCAAVWKRLMSAQGGIAGAMSASAPSPSGLLEVLARYPVGRGTTLVLLKIDRRILLLSQSAPGFGRGASAGGWRTLTEITEPEEVASILRQSSEARGDSTNSRFREMLEGLSRSDHSQTDGVIDASRSVQYSASGDFAELIDDQTGNASDLASVQSRFASLAQSGGRS